MRFKIFDEAGDLINTIIADLAFVEAAYPGRFELVPDPPAPEPPGASPEDVDAERDRRIDAGFFFGGVFYQSRPEDRENIAGAATAALGAMVAGALAGNLRWADPDADFEWIAADNSRHPMDAQTTFAFGQAAMGHKMRHIFSASDLKIHPPIPADFETNEAYWP